MLYFIVQIVFVSLKPQTGNLSFYIWCTINMAICVSKACVEACCSFESHTAKLSKINQLAKCDTTSGGFKQLIFLSVSAFMPLLDSWETIIILMHKDLAASFGITFAFSHNVISQTNVYNPCMILLLRSRINPMDFSMWWWKRWIK